MKSKKRKLLERTLGSLAHRIIVKYAPHVIGITGSVGKTSAKEAIGAVLSSRESLYVSRGNLNNEIGIPLAIFLIDEAPTTVVGWFRVLIKGLRLALLTSVYPKVLVLEYAADRPGDIEYLTKIATPQCAVITAVGEIPVHVEFYSGPDAVAREKSSLVAAVPFSGWIILNADDPRVVGMRERARGGVITYGFGEKADVRIEGFSNEIERGAPSGIRFKLEHKGRVVPVVMERVLGRAQAYAAAAAAAVGIIYEVNLLTIVEKLQNYAPPLHRLTPLRGRNGITIIDDSYNAAPLSMREAFETIDGFLERRKIAVLGDMRELGSFTKAAHEALGHGAAEIFEDIITVGENAELVLAAYRNGKKIRDRGIAVRTAEEACIALQKIVKRGDVVLIKGSLALGMKKVVQALQI